MCTFTLTQVHFIEKTVLLLRYCGRRSSRYFILMQYKLKILQFIPNAPSTFLWAMSDAHSRMIHSFESILFKGLIKPVGKTMNQFVNQFGWFVQFPAARAHWVVSSGSHLILRISRALSAAARDLFQEECICLDTINIDIFTIFTLAEI